MTTRYTLIRGTDSTPIAATSLVLASSRDPKPGDQIVRASDRAVMAEGVAYGGNIVVWRYTDAGVAALRGEALAVPPKRGA